METCGGAGQRQHGGHAQGSSVSTVAAPIRPYHTCWDLSVMSGFSIVFFFLHGFLKTLMMVHGLVLRKFSGKGVRPGISIRMVRSQACAAIGPNRPASLHLKFLTVSKKDSDIFFPH